MNFKKILTKERVLVVSIVILGLLLRLWKWPDYLVFDFEKVRDLIASLGIFQDRNLTLLGPTTEVDGIFHGPLYYYVLGFFYFISGGDPKAASFVSFGFNLAGIVVLYIIGKSLFNTKVGLIAALIYALSFESVSYAYWLSNPGPSIPFLFLMFFFFYKFLTSAKKGDIFLPLALLCWGVSIQFQILNVIFLPSLIALYLVSKKPKFQLKYLLLSALAFFAPLSTFIISDIKHEFLMTKSFIAGYLTSNEGVTAGLNFNLSYFQRLFVEVSNIFIPQSIVAGGLLTILLLVFVALQIKNKKGFEWTFLLIWVLSTLPVFFIKSRMSESHAAFIGVSGAIIITVSFILNLMLKRFKFIALLLFTIFLSANLYAVNNYLTDPQKRLFDYFQGLFLKTNYELVDHVYNETNGEKFRVDTITSPLSISPLWDYLFEWRGKNEFKGRVPVRNQGEKVGYLVIEPQVFGHFKKEGIERATHSGQLVEEKQFGQVTLQKRDLYDQ